MMVAPTSETRRRLVARAAVLEGLRRVLVKEGGDPEEWWERNGTGGPFPFEVELAGP